MVLCQPVGRVVWQGLRTNNSCKIVKYNHLKPPASPLHPRSGYYRYSSSVCCLTQLSLSSRTGEINQNYQIFSDVAIVLIDRRVCQTSTGLYHTSRDVKLTQRNIPNIAKSLKGVTVKNSGCRNFLDGKENNWKGFCLHFTQCWHLGYRSWWCIFLSLRNICVIS